MVPPGETAGRHELAGALPGETAASPELVVGRNTLAHGPLDCLGVRSVTAAQRAAAHCDFRILFPCLPHLAFVPELLGQARELLDAEEPAPSAGVPGDKFAGPDRSVAVEEPGSWAEVRQVAALPEFADDCSDPRGFFGFRDFVDYRAVFPLAVRIRSRARDVEFLEAMARLRRLPGWEPA